MASLARLHNIETQTHLQPLQPWEYDLETVHNLLDEFIQRASKCPPPPSSSPTSVPLQPWEYDSKIVYVVP
jgi:hypothetical protein